MNTYERLCYNLLGQKIKKKRLKYSSLIADIQAARLRTPFEAYLATGFITSIIVGLVSAVVIGAVTFFLKIPNLVKYKGEVPDVLMVLSGQAMLIGTIVAIFGSLAVFGGITYVIYLVYPSIVAGNRKRNIDSTIPYAINFLMAMSTAGISPAEVFKLLGDSKIYGESSVEARFIAREIDLFGKNLIESLKSVSSTTPSMRMREFIQGAIASITSGSNLTEYFRTKSEQYALENRQTQKQFLETLALIAESYVTAMVAGTLFLILIQSVMSMISGQSKPMFLYIIIYMMIPFGSLMFVILINSMTPEW